MSEDLEQLEILEEPKEEEVEDDNIQILKMRNSKETILEKRWNHYFENGNIRF